MMMTVYKLNRATRNKLLNKLDVLTRPMMRWLFRHDMNRFERIVHFLKRRYTDPDGMIETYQGMIPTEYTCKIELAYRRYVEPHTDHKRENY